MPKRRQKFEIRPMTRDDFIEVHEMAQPEGWLVNDNMLDAWFSENPRGCHVAVTKDTGVVIGQYKEIHDLLLLIAICLPNT